MNLNFSFEVVGLMTFISAFLIKICKLYNFIFTISGKLLMICHCEWNRLRRSPRFALRSLSE